MANEKLNFFAAFLIAEKSLMKSADARRTLLVHRQIDDLLNRRVKELDGALENVEKNRVDSMALLVSIHKEVDDENTASAEMLLSILLQQYLAFYYSFQIAKMRAKENSGDIIQFHRKCSVVSQYLLEFVEDNESEKIITKIQESMTLERHKELESDEIMRLEESLGNTLNKLRENFKSLRTNINLFVPIIKGESSPDKINAIEKVFFEITSPIELFFVDLLYGETFNAAPLQIRDPFLKDETPLLTSTVIIHKTIEYAYDIIIGLVRIVIGGKINAVLQALEMDIMKEVPNLAKEGAIIYSNVYTDNYNLTTEFIFNKRTKVFALMFKLNEKKENAGSTSGTKKDTKKKLVMLFK